MTPAARISAAIEILDTALAGTAVEQVLTNWGRANRYAGSGDRRAIRDLVYDALRRKRSCAWVGGGETGRGMMIGALRLAGADAAEIFTGDGYAPSPLTDRDHGQPLQDASDAVRLDCPDWLWARLGDALGDDREAVLTRFQLRAPVFLRVNQRLGSRDSAIATLAQDGIVAVPHGLARNALEVTQGARKVQHALAYLDGLVELQDVASQAVIDALPVEKGLAVLDYCAGGGGKSLALAALGAEVTAHDISAARMRDIPPRAERAGVRIVTTNRPEGRWPMVLIDAPCSGTGTWSRDPESKWLLTEERLQRLTQLQGEVLSEAARHVESAGLMAYVTCSLLPAENAQVIDNWLTKNTHFELEHAQSFSPLSGGDGFGLTLLRRKNFTL